ncbi:hypothetical protein, partial [Hallella seregens]|uniref:hypothetical protein n=1 Tax=Hallella seregens TaxID=52229 RepID=UPI001B7F7DF1
LARVRVYVLERGYASGLRERERESSKLFGTTKQFDEKIAGKFIFPCRSSRSLEYGCCGYIYLKSATKVVNVWEMGKRIIEKLSIGCMNT